MKNPLSNTLRLLAIAAIAVVPLVAAPSASAATDASLSISPITGSATVGGSVSFTINANPGSNPVNLWKAYILYPTGVFSGGSVTTAGGSPFTLNLESTVSGGAISYVASTLSGGSALTYSGPIATVTLNSTAAGSAALAFEHKCVAAGDQACSSGLSNTDSSNVLISNVGPGATFTVSAPVVSSGGGASTGGSTSTNKGGTTKPATTTKPAATTPAGTAPAATTPAATTPQPTTTSTTTNSTTATTAKVTLSVVNQDGKPVVGAKVTIDGVSGTTNQKGQVTLAGISAGAVTGKVSYKGETKPVKLNVKDGSAQPTQTAKLTITVKKSSTVAPIAITVGTLAIVAGAAFLIVGPGGGAGSLIKKLPGIGRSPKPVAPTVTTPPASAPATPAPAPSAQPQTPKAPAPTTPNAVVPRHVDPMTPGTNFTPTNPKIPSI